MVTQTARRKRARWVVRKQRPRPPAASAYFAALLDACDETAPEPGAEPQKPGPIAAPNVAAYLVGLLDNGEDYS
jgi:hypothetical protein